MKKRYLGWGLLIFFNIIVIAAAIPEPESYQGLAVFLALEFFIGFIAYSIKRAVRKRRERKRSRLVTQDRSETTANTFTSRPLQFPDARSIGAPIKRVSAKKTHKKISLKSDNNIHSASYTPPQNTVESNTLEVTKTSKEVELTKYDNNIVTAAEETIEELINKVVQQIGNNVKIQSSNESDENSSTPTIKISRYKYLPKFVFITITAQSAPVKESIANKVLEILNEKQRKNLVVDNIDDVTIEAYPETNPMTSNAQPTSLHRKVIKLKEN